MRSDLSIRYIEHSNINRTKWDACIEKSFNGLIYAYSFYLDAMAKHWDALVLDDYEIIMPLTWNKKYRIHYLYQPAFTASLGIFGNDLSEEIMSAFVKAIPDKFKLIEIAFNYKNVFHRTENGMTMRNNFILPLNKPYPELYASYKENIKRNIKKAQQLGCVIKKDIAVADIIDLSRPSMQRLTNVKESDYVNFEKLFHLLNQKKMAVTYGVYSSKNQLIASCVYFFSHQRAYYILVGNHPDGKTVGASHFLIDSFIKDHAEKKLTLDFEGSDIRNLAFFYSSFGAELETYPFLKINNLPVWMKWMKQV
ncbi:MAG: GNAT family N-acetyltransferase [Bacteroidetes bacterium]|nr:GNAT family N-acetyltransferase [Bacteroidota bacterium]